MIIMVTLTFGKMDKVTSLLEKIQDAPASFQQQGQQSGSVAGEILQPQTHDRSSGVDALALELEQSGKSESADNGTETQSPASSESGAAAADSPSDENAPNSLVESSLQNGSGSESAQAENSQISPDAPTSTPNDNPNLGRSNQQNFISEEANLYAPDSYSQLFFDSIVTPAPDEAGALYLTFDNTPSYNFDAILAVLEKHKIPATFFVWRSGNLSENSALYEKIVSSGHSIGIHSHASELPISALYVSEDVFFDSFSRMFDEIYQATGIKTRLYRLPGGSVSSLDDDRQALLLDIKAELDRRGFLQYDWNASAQDAVSPTLSKDQILANIDGSLKLEGKNVVLMHDGTDSSSTVEALDALITRYKAEGYTFMALNYGTRPVSFLDN